MFRATKIVGFLKAMQQRGVSAIKLLEGTGLDAELVSAPDYLVSSGQYHAVVAHMIKLTNDGGIAFKLSAAVDIHDLGIVGYAMISAPSLREAHDIWFKYSSFLVGTPLPNYVVRDRCPGYEISLLRPPGIGPTHRFETEEILVQAVKLTRDLTGVYPVFEKLLLSYPEPPYRALYDRYFKCPIKFDAPCTAARIISPERDAPIRTKNEELFKICTTHCSEVMRSLGESDPLYSRLRNLFLLSPSKLPTLVEASSVLGVSVSTLCHQLHDAGHNYQSIKDEFRFDLACEYLRSGFMSAKEIAYLLGFSSPSTFARAFKAWSGKTVGQFMKRL